MQTYPRIQVFKTTQKKFLGIPYVGQKDVSVSPDGLKDVLREYFLMQESPLLFVSPGNEEFSKGLTKGNVLYVYHRAGEKMRYKQQTHFQADLKKMLESSINNPRHTAGLLPSECYRPVKNWPGGEFVVEVDEIHKKMKIINKDDIVKHITPYLLQALTLVRKNSSDAAIGIGDDACGYYAYHEV